MAALALLAATAVTAVPAPIAATPVGAQPATPASGAALARLPLRFEENRGQAAGDVRFTSRAAHYSLSLTPTGAEFALARAVPEGMVRAGVAMRLSGASPNPSLTGFDHLPGVTNYLAGKDARNWHTGIPSYGRVRYQDVYAGIDLAYYGGPSGLEYDFDLQPGADPQQIALHFDGGGSPTVDAGGNLVVDTPAGQLRQHRPQVSQDVDGRKQEIPAAFVRRASGDIGFSLSAYDRHRPLVIDPVLSYSSFLGGSADDTGRAVAVSQAGDAYVTGDTISPDFPTGDPAHTLKTSAGGATDAFVVKLNPAGAVVYSTYLGGTGDDTARGIALDLAGDAFVAGVTSSGDFPTTAGAFSTAGSGAYLSELSPDGSKLLYSTILGPAAAVGGVGVGADGNAYVTGQTLSAAFPTTPGAWQPTPASDNQAFVSRIDPTAAGPASLRYSTYLGGTGSGATNAGRGIAVGPAGQAFVTGVTCSGDFPVRGAVQPAYGGACDAFVTRLDTAAAGNASLLGSTFFGGTGVDAGAGIALDAAGAVYVTGTTQSSDLRIAGGFQSARSGVTCYDPGLGLHAPDGPIAPKPCSTAFVAKMAGGTLVYSSYLGGIKGAFEQAPVSNPCLLENCSQSPAAGQCRHEGCNLGNEQASGIAVDGAGKAYVTGRTVSVDFPTTPDALQSGPAGGDCRPAQDFEQYRPPHPCRDGYLATVNPTGTALSFSTYLGGNRDDTPLGIALGSDGSALLTGETDSNDFPTANPAQAAPSGDEPSVDAFVSRVSPGQSSAPSIRALEPRGGPTSGGTDVHITGDRLAGATAVQFGDTAAPFTVDGSGTSINAITPPEAAGDVDVTVTTAAGTSIRTEASRYSFGRGGWSTTGKLNTVRRAGHTATLLPDGTVLVVGGCCDPTTGKPLKSAETYDPKTGVFTPTVGSLAVGRFDHTATLLGNGKVLIAAGYGPNFVGGVDAPTNTAELYDPATRTFAPTGSIGVCTRAPNGATPQACGATYGHTATLLRGSPAVCGGNCGKVIVAGGYQAGGTAAYLRPDKRPTWLYDPIALDPTCVCAGVWTPAQQLAVDGRAFHSATQFPVDPLSGCAANCGKVLLVSGLNNTISFPRPELFDPKSASWTLTQPTAPGQAPPPTEQVARLNHTATVLGNGKVLYAGGDPGMNAGGGRETPTSSAEILDPATNFWGLTGVLHQARLGHAAATLPDGSALIVGGFNRGPLRSAEVYDPAAGSFVPAGALLTPRSIQDIGIPMDPNCELTDAHAPRNYCGGGAEGQPTFSTPGPTATVLSSDPFGFAADPAVCGGNCGRVLILGGSSDQRTELYTPAPTITSIVPASAPNGGGQQVTITGTGFTNGLRSVSFEGMTWPTTHVDSFTQITAVVPQVRGHGPGKVTVVTEGGAVPTPAAFTYDCGGVPRPGQILLGSGYSLIGLPGGSQAYSGSPLYGWFDLGQGGQYSIQSSTQGSAAGHGYWAWYSCPHLVTLAAPGSDAISFPLGAYHASMVGNTSATRPALVSGYDFAARWDPALNGGAGGYHYSAYRQPVQIGVGEGIWVFSYQATTVNIRAQ